MPREEHGHITLKVCIYILLLLRKLSLLRALPSGGPIPADGLDYSYALKFEMFSMTVADATFQMHEHCRHLMSLIGEMIECKGGLLLSDVNK